MLTQRERRGQAFEDLGDGRDHSHLSGLDADLLHSVDKRRLFDLVEDAGRQDLSLTRIPNCRRAAPRVVVGGERSLLCLEQMLQTETLLAGRDAGPQEARCQMRE